MVNIGMSKYIESTYLENIVDYYLGHSNGAEHYAYGVMKGELRIAPAADVVEVKHGHWIFRHSNSEQVYCSECALILDGVAEVFKYCPNCGAYMRETYGENEHE